MSAPNMHYIYCPSLSIYFFFLPCFLSFPLPTLLPLFSPSCLFYSLLTLSFLLAFPPILKDEWLIKLVMVVVVMLPLSMLRNIARLEKVGNINC